MVDTRHNSGRDAADDTENVDDDEHSDQARSDAETPPAGERTNDQLDAEQRAKIEAIHERARREAEQRQDQYEQRQSEKREADAEASANPHRHRDRPPHDS